MQKLSTILNIALRESGIDRAVHQNKALFLWETVVGKTVAKNCVAHEVQRNGVLIVKATTPVWRNEIALKKKDILQKLNRELGKNTIKDIRII